MAHYPLNHHLRQTYRFLAGLAGLYVTLAGILGLAATWGHQMFDREGSWALGLRTNPAAAWLYTVVGLILLAAVVIGGNVLHHIAMLVGWGLCALGVLQMAFLQTDANVLHASMTNVIAAIIIGLVALTAGLYGKTGPDQAAQREQSAASAAR
jgi:Domain of unknown function (DUF4383)